MASFDDVTKKLILYDQHVDVHNGEPILVQGKGEEVAFASAEPLRLECQAFLSAIESRRPPLTDGVSGLQVLKVLQAAQRSLMTNGEPVNMPIEVFA
jgi:predicted dehydrogenase